MASGDLKPKAIRTGRGHVRIRSGRSEGSRSETLYLPSAKGWGVLVTRLEQKAPGRVEQVNAAYTSQRCHACGYTAAESRESQARFGCRSCGHTAHADLNAARNIAAGHAGTARGGPAVAGPVNREPQHASLPSGSRSWNPRPFRAGRMSTGLPGSLLSSYLRHCPSSLRGSWRCSDLATVGGRADTPNVVVHRPRSPPCLSTVATAGA